MDSAEFECFLGALRRGDRDAAERLVHLYGPDIGRLIRAKLKAGELRRVTDSVDICPGAMMVVTPGAMEFMMGLSPTEVGRNSDELPHD